MTVVELSVTIALLGIVVAGLLAVMNSAQTNLGRQISRSDSNDQLRQAVEAMDREVRSGDVLYDPATESYSAGDITPYMSIRIYTESNEPTRGKKCVQWRITSPTATKPNELQVRSWEPNWTDAADSSQVSGWRTVATGVVNRITTAGVNSPGGSTLQAFKRPPVGSSNYLNIILVDLRADSDTTTQKGLPVEAQQSISGRNTEFFSTSTACGSASAAPSSSGPGIPPY